MPSPNGNGVLNGGTVIPVSPSVRTSGPTRQTPNLAWTPDVPTVLYSDPKQSGDGSYVLNEDKTLVSWRWIPAKFQHHWPVTIAAGATVDGIVINPGGANGTRGDFEAASLLCTHENGRMAILPYVTSPIDRF